METERKPYARMAPYFGAIFPCTPEHRACYDRELPVATGKRVLDIGFGTGEHLAYLAGRGADVYGAEVEGALVDFARQRFNAPADHFKQCGMESVSKCFGGSKFALVLMVGNTLPHARDMDEAARALREMARLTAADGKAVVSVVNYDRVLERRVTALPLIEGETEDGRAYRFTRSYDLDDAPRRVVFRTRLETPDGVIEGEHALLPIRKAELADMAAAAFGEVSVFGGYRREPWTMDSFSAVVAAASPRSGPSA